MFFDRLAAAERESQIAALDREHGRRAAAVAEAMDDGADRRGSEAAEDQGGG